MENLAIGNMNLYYDSMLALMPGHVYWKDKAGVLQGCNNNLAAALKLSSREEIIGKTDYDIAFKEEAEAIREIDADVIIRGKARIDEELYTFSDGSQAVYLTQRCPIFNPQNEVVGIIGISLDITEKKKLEKEISAIKHKLDGMTLVSSSIAHELRTPLASLNINAEVLQNFLPILINNYERKNKSGDASTQLDTEMLDHLKELPNILKRETQGANLFIDMLLMNLNPHIEPAGEIFSICDCVNEALTRYPFKQGQRELLHWQDNNNFSVKGKPILIVHILFNLIKNALFYIKWDGTESINIYLEPGKKTNKLIFKDTGRGIAPEDLPHIFDHFFSKTRNSAGVGLTYCKTVMESLGGSIQCESVLGQYTQFILVFPAIETD